MVSSAYFPSSKRQNGFHDSYSGLPVYSSAVEEKRQRQGLSTWTTPVSLALPGVRTRRLRLVLPNARRIHHFTITRFGRKRGLVVLLLGLLVTMWTLFAVAKRIGTHEKKWLRPFPGPPSTLVFHRADLQRIWKWEIASGHYPSHRRIPEGLGLASFVENPAVPPYSSGDMRSRSSSTGVVNMQSRGVGPNRTYLDIQNKPPNVAYPPRPVPGSIADLDAVMDHCDFSQKKYVRDCLEVLRVGAGLDNGKRVRRGKMDSWKYIYAEVANTSYVPPTIDIFHETRTLRSGDSSDPDAGLTKKRGAEWDERVVLGYPLKHRPYKALQQACDEEHPRLFHMFWTGPFTDKPYLALLSFLYTQNTGIHLPSSDQMTGICKPKFWLWINPGPAASVPNPAAVHDMFEELKANPWASPFLHPRFKDVIEFKLWNTTEQLDGVDELKNEWRTRDLFNSGGHIISVPSIKQSSQTAAATVENGTFAPNGAPSGNAKAPDDDVLNRTGSKSSSSYDRLSVILSDMARFILCHRFGGIYLDADTIFLRDWEELWGWKGAFAYRWSRLEKYNTAVLRLNKQSALGKFLFRTALKNNLDFHPMTVSQYTKDAHLEPLLLRLPDALFDPAWLNVEDYQRDRPAQPFFTDFANLFDTPPVNSAAPQALGFEGFFRGSFSYHFHNFWWKPFDPVRNWPDLGPRFLAGERAARGSPASNNTTSGAEDAPEEERVEDDRRDLDWATVLKRTFESYIRGERPNMYGEWIQW